MVELAEPLVDALNEDDTELEAVNVGEAERDGETDGVNVEDAVNVRDADTEGVLDTVAVVETLAVLEGDAEKVEVRDLVAEALAVLEGDAEKVEVRDLVAEALAVLEDVLEVVAVTVRVGDGDKSYSHTYGRSFLSLISFTAALVSWQPSSWPPSILLESFGSAPFQMPQPELGPQFRLLVLVESTHAQLARRLELEP